MNELLSIAVDRLAEHYHVSGDYLRKALLIRGVAELSAVTDRTKPATPEDLEWTLAAMNRQLDEVIDKFRKQATEIDDAVQHANIALAVIDRVTAALAADMKNTATDPRPL
jgi:prophage DNA circulation protein